MSPAPKCQNGSEQSVKSAEIGSKVLVLQSGRIGEVVLHDPDDSDLTYKVKFFDGRHPDVDWCSASGIDPLPAAQGADALPSLDQCFCQQDTSTGDHGVVIDESDNGSWIEKMKRLDLADQVYSSIDISGAGRVSKLEMLAAAFGNESTHVDSEQTPSYEEISKEIGGHFDEIACSRENVTRQEFVEYVAERMTKVARERFLSFFKHEVKPQPRRLSWLSKRSASPVQTPRQKNDGRTQSNLRNDTSSDAMGKTSPSQDSSHLPTLLQSLRSAWSASDDTSSKCVDKQRNEISVLIISPGFGRDLNPKQAALVQGAGFRVHYANLPNPDQAGFNMDVQLPHLQKALATIQPDVLISASKGNAYVTALWQKGLWVGPVVMLNAAPNLRRLPSNITVVLAHGSNDELYRRSREDLEMLISTGSANRCFLYYTGNSGQTSGGLTRVGDTHNMASLIQYDCLPCLIDAAVSRSGPEMCMMRGWRARLAPLRNEAEHWLTHCLDKLQRLWTVSDHSKDVKKLHEVHKESEEFSKLATIFYSDPQEAASYQVPQSRWKSTRILKVERVENGILAQSTNAYHKCVQTSIEEQGLVLEGGVHTRWAFHGTDQIESIVEDPITGFQPLASGVRLGSLWGSGTYFARDARHVVDGNFCPLKPDGTRQILLCLLMIGVPCLGDPRHHGVLPFRQKPYRYNSSVDSLSSPEIFVTQHPGAAYPAYLVTFR